MFARTPSELRNLSDELMKRAEDAFGYASYFPITLYKQAINTRMMLGCHLTADDRRKIASCYDSMSSVLLYRCDESKEDEFETRCRHPDFFAYLKEAIYQIDDIPAAEQTADDCESVVYRLSWISTNYYYFGIPDEAIMDDDLLHMTGKYEFKDTMLNV